MTLVFGTPGSPSWPGNDHSDFGMGGSKSHGMGTWDISLVVHSEATETTISDSEWLAVIEALSDALDGLGFTVGPLLQIGGISRPIEEVP